MAESSGLRRLVRVAIGVMVLVVAAMFLLPVRLWPSLPAHAQLHAPTPVFEPLGFFTGHTAGAGSFHMVLREPMALHVQGLGNVAADGSLGLAQQAVLGTDAPIPRQWTLRRVAGGGYAATLSDASGPVEVAVDGNRLHLRFAMLGGLAQGEQWLYLQPDRRSAANFFTVSIGPVPLMAVTETIRRVQAPPPAAARPSARAPAPALPGGGLAAHEAAGGHVLARHVGLSEAALLRRLAAEPDISAASSFPDRATAERAIAATLEANARRIQDWLKGSSARLRVHMTGDRTVGISARRGSSAAAPVRSTRVILLRDAAMPGGYRILTAYPAQP